MPATKLHTGRTEDTMRAQFAADFATGRVTAASCHRCGYGVGVTLEHSCAKCGGAVAAHMADRKEDVLQMHRDLATAEHALGLGLITHEEARGMRAEILARAKKAA